MLFQRRCNDFRRFHLARSTQSRLTTSRPQGGPPFGHMTQYQYGVNKLGHLRFPRWNCSAVDEERHLRMRMPALRVVARHGLEIHRVGQACFDAGRTHPSCTTESGQQTRFPNRPLYPFADANPGRFRAVALQPPGRSDMGTATARNRWYSCPSP